MYCIRDAVLGVMPYRPPSDSCCIDLLYHWRDYVYTRFLQCDQGSKLSTCNASIGVESVLTLLTLVRSYACDVADDNEHPPSAFPRTDLRHSPHNTTITIAA